MRPVSGEEPAGNVGDDLGAALLEARRKEGLSLNALSDLSGLSRPTLRAAEAGRDARLSTLTAYLRALPKLAPPDLFPATVGRPPPQLGEAWRFRLRNSDLRLRSVRRRVRIEGDCRVSNELTVLVVPTEGVDLSDPGVRLHVARTLLDAPAAVLRGVTAPGLEPDASPLRIEHEDVAHELSWSKATSEGELCYRRTARWSLPGRTVPTGLELALATGCLVTVEHPTEELRLELEWPAGDQPAGGQVVRWPASLVPQGAALPRISEADLDLQERDSSHVLRARLQRPLVGQQYALDPSHSLSTHPMPCSSAAGPGEILRAAREWAGLSMRELGRRMAVSTATIRGAETGNDLRASTLARYFEQLPSLSPWQILSHASPERLEFSRERAWAFERDLVGCEAGEETKLIKLTRRGNARIVIETKGLRWLRPAQHPLRVRVGGGRLTPQSTHAELDAIAMDRSLRTGLRIRQAEGARGGVHHELVIPAELAREGVSFARHLRHSGVFTMTARRGRARTGVAGPFREGTTFEAPVPARRLRIVVVFPDRYWPEDVRSHVWGATEAPSSSRGDLSERLHPDGIAVTEDRESNCVSLEVEHALPTFKHALGWQLP